MVKVTDVGGLPVSGATVAFTVRQGAGTLSAASAVSDTAGVASTIWTMGPTMGPQRLVAVLGGAVVLDSTAFTATATNGPAAVIAIDAGNGQHGPVGSTLTTQLSAKVTDASGNPVPGSPVTWTAATSAGQVTAIRQNTDSTGHAFATWTLGTTQGLQAGTATAAPGVTATFGATAAAGSAAQLVQVAGTGQTGTVGSVLGTLLSVRAVDSFGNAVAGAAVSFTATQGSITVLNSVTDSLGLMLARWTLSQTPGTQNALAALAGTTPVAFVATARAGGATSVTVETGANQTSTVRQTLPLPLVARITDSFGNPVAGMSVSWTVVHGGGSLLAATATSDSTGRATALWTLGGTPGSQAVTLGVPALPLVTINATATPATATQLVQVAGSGQTGVVGTVLTTLLSVRAVDAAGNGVVGAPVSFSAAQGIIAQLTPVTDSLGGMLARWTLGNQPGVQNALAALAGTTPTAFVATARSSGPSTAVVETGNNQTQAVSQTLPLPLVAKISDSFGNPVSGITVTWTVAQGGGSLLATSATSDAFGRATAVWTLGGTVGTQLATLAVPGLPLVVFSATATPGSLDTLAIVAGNNQSGIISTALASPLIVRVVDAHGNPEVGITVIFAVVSGGGSVLPSLATTDANGLATANWKLGSLIGVQTLTASAGTKTVTFVALGSITGGGGGGPPAQIVLVSGNGQTGNVAAQLGAPVVVKFVDANGIPVGGVSLTWTLAAGNAGGSVSPVTSVTDGGGQAVTLWLLGSQIGLQNLTAHVASPPAVPGPLSLGLVATATLGSSGAVVINSGNNQTHAASSPLASPIQVEVVDQNNNPVVGAHVTWAVVTGGGSVTPTSVFTGAGGLAATSWTLGPSVGVQTAVASVSGVGSVTFTATATTVGATPTQIVLVSGNAQSGNVSTQLAQSVVVKVVDINGLPVTGATVTWRDSTSNNGGFVSPTSSVTDVNGLASTTWLLGNQIGLQYVWAQVPAVPAVLPLRLNATATMPSTGAVLIFDGNNQTHAASLALTNPIRVEVVDQFNNPVVGAPVTWVVASGGGSVSVSAGLTIAGGLASTNWTLGAALGSQTVTASVAGVGSVTFTATATAVTVPTQIVLVSGNAQAGNVSTQLGAPVVVKVVDVNGLPVSGATVTWRDSTSNSGGFVSPTSSVTDVNGLASTTWLLGNQIGLQYVWVQVPAVPAVLPLRLNATATISPSGAVLINSGNNQTAATSVALTNKLYVKVIDQFTNAVVGAPVTWVVATGGGSVSLTSGVTDASGLDSTAWTLGSTVGAQTVTATVAGVGSVTFTATATSAGTTPTQIVLVSGNAQAGSVSTQLGAPVVVKVVDVNGLPVSGATVTWRDSTSNNGGFVSPTSSVTDVNGLASTTWLLGNQIGLQYVWVQVPAVPAVLPLRLSATATISPSGAVLIESGNNQTAATGVALTNKLYVKVIDQFTNAIVGAPVTWVVASGGGSVSLTSGITDASGLDSTAWTLGSTVGAQTVTATVAGVGSVTFTANGTTGGGLPSSLLLISGNGQVGRSQQALTSPLVVEVRDASGNPLSGITVIFTPAAANGFTSPAPATTGSNGQASVTWTLGPNTTNTTVPMSVVASVGLLNVTFTATARPEYRIVRIATPLLQTDTTGATIGAAGDYSAGVRDTLRVQVYDPVDSSGVQGVPVTWATQAGVGDGHPLNASTVTDNFGYAKTLWVLRRDDNGQAIAPSNVAKRMFATATNPVSTVVVGQVEFQANPTPGHACSDTLNSVSGTPAVGSNLAMATTVLDCNGFPVPGAAVTFAVGAGSGSVSVSSAFTNAAGQAFTTWTLGTSITPNVQSMTATVTAQPTNPYVIAAPFPTSLRTVTVVAGAPLTVAFVVPPPLTASINSPVAITVIVTDAYGNVVSGQIVTFAASGGGVTPGKVSSATGTTTSGGTTGVIWTMGSDVAAINSLIVTAGGATISASITGVP